MTHSTASEQIDHIIETYGGWKGTTIARLRAIITEAAPDITEDIKWKMKTRPEGLPVWSRGGIVCYIETWTDNMKLIFFKGSQLADPTKLFNARLKSATVRAIEIHEGDEVNEAGIQALVREAVALNTANTV